jgi:DNA-binding NtrC family response regulator
LVQNGECERTELLSIREFLRHTASDRRSVEMERLRGSSAAARLDAKVLVVGETGVGRRSSRE